MSSDVDSDREDLFQTLTALTAVTEDEVLEFSWALEKNMLIRSSFFALCLSVTMLVC